MMKVKALIADDHPIFVEGLKCILRQPGYSFLELIDTATNGLEAYHKVKRLNPELLLIDMNMPEMDGPEVIKRLRKEGLPVQVLVLSMYDQPRLIRKAFKAGADAYVLKDKAPEELKEAVEALQNQETYFGKGVHLNESGRHKRFQTGKTYDRSDQFVSQHLLTKRELEILNLIVEAHSNKEIGKRLFISDQTVGVHRKNIMRKLGVTNTAGLIKAAHYHALI
ncbi:MAG: response regulator transcription factor [Phaeodactylibacter sp.]|uniref:response regulator transcription factor n=1 Tax=Phaeodactylibacter sp. TaxID=1940289 RepID=UPI0032F050F4